jgi:hypothetical protein
VSVRQHLHATHSAIWPALKEGHRVLSSLKRSNYVLYCFGRAVLPDHVLEPDGRGPLIGSKYNSIHIVLIDGDQLTRLMIRHGVGCRIEETLYIKKVDEEFLE